MNETHQRATREDLRLRLHKINIFALQHAKLCLKKHYPSIARTALMAALGLRTRLLTRNMLLKITSGLRRTNGHSVDTTQSHIDGQLIFDYDLNGKPSSVRPSCITPWHI